MRWKRINSVSLKRKTFSTSHRSLFKKLYRSLSLNKRKRSNRMARKFNSLTFKKMLRVGFPAKR